jgi:hypothetical protein
LPGEGWREILMDGAFCAAGIPKWWPRAGDRPTGGDRRALTAATFLRPKVYKHISCHPQDSRKAKAERLKASSAPVSSENRKPGTDNRQLGISRA